MAKQSGGAARPGPTIVVVESYCPVCERSFPDALERCPDDDARLIRLTQKEVELVGAMFDGRFEILDLLGDGGMGAVYRAREAARKRLVAIKVIRAELTNDIDIAKRFLREARVSARVNHPNTVTVYDYGQTSDGMLYLAMELLDGETLEAALSSDGRMAPSRAGAIVAQIFEALSAAHRAGVIHRDLKPSNIMLQRGRGGRDFVKVLDFGLAKSLGSDFNTTAGFLMGTPAYLAPELILRGDVNFASDLYAVGVLMYEILAGRVPFDDDEIPAVLMAHAHRPPPPLPFDVPESITSFVFRLLAKKPGDRFPSASAAREALTLAMADLTDINPLDVAKTTEIRKLQVSVDWDDAETDNDEAGGTGTLRFGETPPPKRAPGAFGGARPVSAKPSETTDTEVSAIAAARGEAQGKARRRLFMPTKTKLLTPVPPLRDMQEEILSAVADDEHITREMVALFESDTDRTTPAPDDEEDTHDETERVSKPLTVDMLGPTIPQPAIPGSLPILRLPQEQETAPMPRVRQQALLSEISEGSEADLAVPTGLVGRGAVRDVIAAHRGGSRSAWGRHWLWWLCGGLGAGIGWLAWWLLH